VSEVYKEEERGPAYANYLKKAAEEPLIVGAHWFQYLDQPATGRLLDGENGHLGLVGITDRPWQGFVETVRKANLGLAADINKPLESKAPAKEQPEAPAKEQPKQTAEPATDEQPAEPAKDAGQPKDEAEVPAQAPEAEAPAEPAAPAEEAGKP
jgi:hypothetical protein